MRVKHWTMAAALLAVVAGGIAVWVGAENARRAASIGALTTYVLVVVTTAYVVATFGLLRAQRSAPLREAQAAGLIQLRATLHRHEGTMAILEGLTPFDPDREPDVVEIERADQLLLDLYWDLRGLIPLVPVRLREVTRSAWMKVWKASVDFTNVRWACQIERERTTNEERPWSWESVRRIYRTEHEVGRELPPDVWDRMMRGEVIRDAKAALSALDEQLLAIEESAT